MVTSEEFRAALNVQPFRPFHIHMADGRVFNVADPERVAVSPQWRAAIILRAQRKLQHRRLAIDVRIASHKRAIFLMHGQR